MRLIIIINDILKLFNEQQRDYVFHGKESTRITSFSSIDDLKTNSVSWMKKGFVSKNKNLLKTKDVLIITDDKSLAEMEFNKANFLICEYPRDYFFSILSYFFPKENKEAYISESAVVESLNIHPSVYIGSNSFIGKNVKIEADSIISNNVTIKGNIVIGKNTIIQSGVVLGSDGFGYYKDHNGVHMKIEHYGGITIGNNVEIGANACIDRGTFSNTTIGNNVKLGNLCQISHNVIIEKNVLVAASTSISGSTLIKKDAYIAPGSTIRNKLTIGESSFIGLGSVVVKNVEDGKTVAGSPAKELENK